MKLSTFKLLFTSLATIALLATQPGASCVSDTSSDGSSPSNSPVDTDSNEIPRRAAIVKEGRGAIEWTADSDGDLYVQDLKSETTIVTRRIHRGEKVSVVPDENRVRLDDDSIYKGDLKKDHVHRIYLLRDARFNDRDQHDHARNDDRNGGVPSHAKVIGEGANKEISFEADHDGKAYVLESDTRKLVATVDIEKGERFVFSPGADKISVAGKRVVARDFDPNLKYRVYFNR